MATTKTSSPGRYIPGAQGAGDGGYGTGARSGTGISTSPNIDIKTPFNGSISRSNTILQRQGATAAVKPAAGQNGPTTNQIEDKNVPALPDMSGNKSKVEVSKSKNPLNSYRNYNYLFTLAALKKEALDDPSSYRDNEDEYFVIAKSAGKGTNSSYGGKDTDPLVSTFKIKSAGQFDFYINNVRIDTLMGFDKKTGVSTAIKIEFDLFEPYSMTGFIEALQTSAVAMGNDQYVNTPFLLKMEFIGYPDSQSVSDTPEIIQDSTRYFVFTFTGLKIDVNENGTRYQCKGVPFNERGFGEATKLKSPIKVTGNTVGKLLTDLEHSLNKAMQDEADSTYDKGSTKHDTYTIEMPLVDDESGMIVGTDNEKISAQKVLNLLVTPANYKFPDNGDRANAEKTQTPLHEMTVSFSDGHSISDCITSIIRDSDYTKNLVATFDKSIDAYGMVNYFTVLLEVTDLKVINPSTLKPYYNYKFLIIPYKMHYTRMPLSQSSTVDPATKLLVANREYDYLYTGANLDIKRFNLNFNTLFFQAIPKAMGNKEGITSASGGVQSANNVNMSTQANNPTDATESSIGKNTVAIDSSKNKVHVGDTLNSGVPDSNPYAQLAKNLHQAILDNVDQVSAEIEIIGDPFYLVTSGVGNYKPATKSFGETMDGEAAFTTGDVMIVLTFRNPIDVNSVTGEAIFSDTITPYSGLFRVIKVASTFNDGQFSQKLNLLRVASQIEDTKKPYTKPTPLPSTTSASEEPVAAKAATPMGYNPSNIVENITNQVNASVLLNATPILTIPTITPTLTLPTKISPLSSIMNT